MQERKQILHVEDDGFQKGGCVRYASAPESKMTKATDCSPSGSPIDGIMSELVQKLQYCSNNKNDANIPLFFLTLVIADSIQITALGLVHISCFLNKNY